MTRFFSAICLALVLTQTTLASITTYTDRNVFNAASPGLPTEDFEETTPAAGGFSVEDAPISATTDGNAYNPGDILAGLIFQDLPLGPGGGTMIIGGTGLFPGSTMNVGANTFADALEILLTGGVTSIGFDLYSSSAPGSLQNSTVTIELFDSSNMSLGIFNAAAVSTGSVFFGAISDMGLITRLTVFSQSNGAEFVDNVSFGNVAAPPNDGVPEPAAWMVWMLFAPAIMGQIWYAKRRRQA